MAHAKTRMKNPLVYKGLKEILLASSVQWNFKGKKALEPD